MPSPVENHQFHLMETVKRTFWPPTQEHIPDMSALQTHATQGSSVESLLMVEISSCKLSKCKCNFRFKLEGPYRFIPQPSDERPQLNDVPALGGKTYTF